MSIAIGVEECSFRPLFKTSRKLTPAERDRAEGVSGTSTEHATGCE